MNVDDVVRIKIADAARKIEAARQRREEQQRRRAAGLALRNARRLRNLASARTTDGPDSPPKEKPMKHDDAILVTEDGTVITLNLPADRERFAGYAAAVLRCTSVEVFELTTGVVAWVDEDGHGRWGYNALADALINRYGHVQSLSGPVLITGYTAAVEPLPADTANRLLLELNDIPA